MDKKILTLKKKQLREDIIKIANKKKSGESLSEGEAKIVKVIEGIVVANTKIEVLIAMVGLGELYKQLRLAFDHCYKKTGQGNIVFREDRSAYLKCRIKLLEGEIKLLEQSMKRCKNTIKPDFCIKKAKMFISIKKHMLEDNIRKLEKRQLKV